MHYVQTKMILRPLPYYQCSFNYTTVGAWQNSEVASRAGDFEIELKYDFFPEFSLKTHYYPAYYIMAD